MGKGKNTAADRKRRVPPGAPKPGDPDFLTPTQLRNRRKRKARKRGKEEDPSKSSEEQQQNGQKNSATLNKVDPSTRYLAKPLACPVVKSAKQFWRTTSYDGFKVYLGETQRWRTVSKLAVRPDEDGKVTIGLFAPNSHDVLPLPKCRMHHPSINKAVEVITKACHSLSVVPYREAGKSDEDDKGSGQLRYVAVNVERSTGAAQITLVWNESPPSDGAIDNPLLRKLASKIVSSSTASSAEVEEPPKKRRRGRRGGKTELKSTRANDGGKQTTTFKLHSLWINYHNSWKHSNAVFAFDSKCWKRVEGPSAVVEHLKFENARQLTNSDSLADPAPLDFKVPLHFPPNVFRQANLCFFTCIVARIRERTIKLKEDEVGDLICTELYGGVGTIGLHLSDLVTYLVSSDENPNNNTCFTKTVREFPPEVQSKLEYKRKDATAMVRSEKEMLSRSQVLIVDPPRKGLDEEVVDYICTGGHEHLKLVAYVSCGFKAFERDCKKITGSGKWRVEFAEGYILFPGSDAIETLAFFVPM